MDSKTSFRILMFPWLAHGHIFPYLELATRILKKRPFHIYLCTTPINFPSITQFIHNNHLSNSIQVVELHLHPHPHLPPHYHTTKNLPAHLNFTLIKAFQTSKSSFSHILTHLNPHLVIYDVFQPWAAKIASSRGIPAVHFNVTGAATRAFNYHQYIHRDGDFPFPELFVEAHERKSTDDLIQMVLDEVFDQDKDATVVNYRLSSEFVLLKTCRALEGKYIAYVSEMIRKRILAVGPLVTGGEEEEEKLEILEWLSKKKQSSTVYVSFGSEHFLSNGEIQEMAKGLELSGANFIWVIRFPVMEKETVSVEEGLPQGFLDRVRNRGLVVSGWAPQASILGHPSTGAFISHCGWSSLNESMYYGVPVIGMPIRLNMFVDIRMLVHAGACVEVARGEDGAFDGDEIAKAIVEVVVGKSGEGMRARAKELSEKMIMEEEGAIEEVAESLWQLCCRFERKDE